MPEIDQYLEDNPTLKSKNRQDVADFVFETEFAGRNVDRATFNEFFLGEQQGPISGAIEGTEGFFNSIGSAIKSGASAAVDAFKGDAEFEAGNINSGGYGNSLGIGLASVLGNNEDYEAAVLKEHPELVASSDKNGNRYVTNPEGERYYIDQPGADIEDLLRFGGKAAAFIPAGKAVSAASAAGKGLLARAGIGAAGAGATDLAMQATAKEAAGSGEIDKAQIALTSIFGGSAEISSAVVSRAIQGAKKRFGNGNRWSKLSEKGRGKVVANMLGNADDLDDKQLKRLGKLDAESGELIVPEAMIADAEFGFQLTKGKAMRNADGVPSPAAYKQLSIEERLKNSPSGEKLRVIDAENASQTDSTLSKISSQFDDAGDALVSAERVKDNLKLAQGVYERRVAKAYEEAAQFTGEVDDEVILSLPGRLTSKLEGSNVLLDDDLTPRAAKVIKRLTDEPRTTIRDLDAQRKLINNTLSDTADPSDKRALTIIKKEYDDILDEAIDRGLFIGSTQAMSSLKNARSQFADYARKFRNDSKSGKVIQRILEDDPSPEEVTQYIFGASGLSSAGAANVVKDYRGIVGSKSDAWKAMRESAFLALTKNPKTGDNLGGKSLINSLRKGLTGNRQTIVNELFTKAERDQMSRFIKALDQTLDKGEFGRTSGTAERMLRFAGAGAFRNFEVLNILPSILESYGIRQATQLPVNAAQRLPITEAGGAVISSQ